jgi:hypothetical protein
LRTRPHVHTRRHPDGFSVAQAPIVILARHRFEVEAIHLSGFWPRTCTLTSHRLGKSSFHSRRCLSLVALAYVTMVLTARGEGDVAAFRSPPPETRARICESELKENGQLLGLLREDSTRENSIGRVNRLQCVVYFIKSIDLAERPQGHRGLGSSTAFSTIRLRTVVTDALIKNDRTLPRTSARSCALLFCFSPRPSPLVPYSSSLEHVTTTRTSSFTGSESLCSSWTGSRQAYANHVRERTFEVCVQGDGAYCSAPACREVG